jgi:hypothetical protein
MAALKAFDQAAVSQFRERSRKWLDLDPIPSSRRKSVMSPERSSPKPVIDWLTLASIAAIAISLTVAFHEGVHALTCISVGGRLLEYSALYEDCANSTILQGKIIAGSAPTFNLLAGLLLWIILPRLNKPAPETWYFLWLLMLMNWCYGAGYLILSGVTNIGDWAVVFEGFEPAWLWRLSLGVLGVALFIILLRLSLKEFGGKLGGDPEEQIQRANKIFVISYVTSFLVVLGAGFFCPYGLVSLPVTAGLAAVLGALSPLVWMVRWFRTEHFEKPARDALEIHRKWGWLVAALIVVFGYIYILGQTLYF